MSTLLRLDGHIAGAGTCAGTRVVLGAWTRAPWGPLVDVMLARPDGHRILFAPDRSSADLIGNLYTFDEVRVVPVTLRRTGTTAGSRWQVRAPGLHWDFTLGRRHPIGAALAVVPGPVSRSPAFARMLNPLTALLMPGVRTHARSMPGRAQWYAARDLHTIRTSCVRLDGRDQGGLAPVQPSPSFGFSSVPARPAVTRLSSLIRDDGAISGRRTTPEG